MPIHAPRRARRGAGATLAAAMIVLTGCSGATDEAVESASTPVAAEQPSTIAASAPATPGPATSTVEEVRFTSGDFELVGDLTLPAGSGPHGAVIVVHGDGPQTRTSTPGTDVVLARFVPAGYAVLVWDKPGSGESTGDFEPGQTLRQRAEILADGVRYLSDHDAVDGDRIGFWGLSQAGWVMPLALERSERVAFMIVVSGGGEDGIEQMGYQLGQRVVCEGRSPEEGHLVETYFPQVAKGPTFDDYIEAMAVLVGIEGWESFAGPDLKTEESWQPWPNDIDAYFDPMSVIDHTTIPVLAVFGEMDRFVDPVQGAAAYERALRAAGNPNYRVALIPGAGHTMLSQSTMCGSGGATSPQYLRVLDDWLEVLDASLA